MPLLNGDTLAELPQAFQCLHELFQGIVAFRVELAVLEEFVHRFLFSLDEHVL